MGERKSEDRLGECRDRQGQRRQTNPTVTKIAENERAYPDDSNVYIGNKNTKKLHLPTCRTLPKEENQIQFDSRQNAINEGYAPCKNCNPPV